MTGLERQPAKNSQLRQGFGAGVRKFAAMIGKPESEARAIYELRPRAAVRCPAQPTVCRTRAHATGLHRAL